MQLGSPELFFKARNFKKNKSNFLILLDIFTNFDKYMHQNSDEIGFYGAARKNIFGKVVALYLKELNIAMLICKCHRQCTRESWVEKTV